MPNLYQDKHDSLCPERGPAEEEGGYDHNWKWENFQFMKEARKKPFWNQRFLKKENSVNLFISLLHGKNNLDQLEKWKLSIRLKQVAKKSK